MVDMTHLQAIYGGTFDPVHYGHLKPVEILANQIGLSKVIIMPNNVPPHRPQPEATSAQRVHMLKLAIADKPLFTLDERELRRDTPSWTAQTLQEWRQEQGPRKPLAFIIGQDSLLTFPTWHNYETILDNVHLIVCRRPGYPLTMAQEADQRWLDRHLTHDVESLHNRPSGVIYLAETPWFDISATIIRQRLERGGRLFYLGAGTSGRLGILDASECPPTYGTDPELVQGLIAGGLPAIFRAQEGAEDNPDLAVEDLKEHDFTEKDVLVGIAASGRTPYVIGGLNYAKALGALTIALSCSEHSKIAALADIALTPVTGPEIVTGSTRMKAGTAQKLVLNMLSTGTMIKLGKVYGNLMVDVKASNKKLAERAIRIVMEGSGCARSEAETALQEAGGHAKLAILMVVAGVSASEGQRLLDCTAGHLEAAIRQATGGTQA